MHPWLIDASERLAAATGADPSELLLDDAQIGQLLDLARVAAHDSGERINAPLLCFLCGVLHAKGHSLEDMIATVG
jgi:hypothetical protein